MDKRRTKANGQKDRKLLTIYKSFHPRDDVYRLYRKGVQGGRGLESVEDIAEIEKCSLGHYLIGTDEEEFLKEVKRENAFKDEEDPKERKKTIKTEEKKDSLRREYILYFGKEQRG